MATFCEFCKHVEPHSRKKRSFSWTCMQHKRLSGAQFVVEGMINQDGPYLLCDRVNGGMCPLFEQLEED